MPRFSLTQLFLSLTALAVGWGGTAWLSQSTGVLSRQLAIGIWFGIGAMVGSGVLNLIERPILGAMLGVAFQALLLITMFERFHF